MALACQPAWACGESCYTAAQSTLEYISKYFISKQGQPRIFQWSEFLFHVWETRLPHQELKTVTHAFGLAGHNNGCRWEETRSQNYNKNINMQSVEIWNLKNSLSCIARTSNSCQNQIHDKKLVHLLTSNAGHNKMSMALAVKILSLAHFSSISELRGVCSSDPHFSTLKRSGK